MSFLHRLFKFGIFKFRTTLSEELDDLHHESLRLQQSLTQTRLLERKWTKSFFIYAVLAFVVINLTYYTLFLSRDYAVRIYSVLITIMIGALIYGIHWLICWYFRTNIHMKEERLMLFKERKQELIEEVKNKETYAVAKTLLEKYGEVLTAQPAPPTADNSRDLRQRVSIKPTLPGQEKAAAATPPSNIGTLQNVNFPPQTPVRGGPTRLAAGVTPGKLPRAILPPQRTFWGTILDAIVGDGPTKRYALICKSCNSHNGMALEEEFEYLSFRCAYCNYFNGARKQKPVFQGDIVAQDPERTTAPAPPSTTTTNTQSAQNESTVERMELSGSDESDSVGESETKGNSAKVNRRSIRIPATNSNDRDAPRSRSTSIEKRRPQHHPALSSSDESLSGNK